MSHSKKNSINAKELPQKLAQVHCSLDRMELQAHLRH
jgi:hypothetical protein